MTADQRLDQLEPLVSQTLAVADRHTAQLKQLVNLVTQQSDNTQFILQELVKMKGELGEMKGELGELKVESRESKEKQTAMDSKLDRILDLLNGSR